MYLAVTEREVLGRLRGEDAAHASYRQVRTQWLMDAEAARLTRLCTDDVPELRYQFKGADFAQFV